MSGTFNLLVSLKNNAVFLRRMSFNVRSFLARQSSFWPIYRAYIWWDQKNITSRGIAEANERVVGDWTELVIDGFPGSANSFASAAFEFSQKKPVKLAHHMHSPVQIIQGVHRKLPTLVTIRPPKGAVLSLTSRWPHITIKQGLKNYIRFYKKLLPFTDQFVVTTFPQTTQHFDSVVAEVNSRFGTHFDLLEMSDANLKAIRKPEKFSTEEWKRRQAEKQRKLILFENEEVKRLLKRAEQIHQQMAEFAVYHTESLAG